MSSPNTPHTSSGITTTTTGDRHIPSSVRADGSVRKEIKIRPGYKPPEDVEVYKNPTAEAWKTRGSGGVPGATSVDQDSGSKSSNNKNAKRREARKRAKAAEEAQDDAAQLTDQANGNSKPEETTNVDISLASNQNWRSKDKVLENPVVHDPEVEREKQARNLKKKLRQARDLREKKDKGENLLPEQFEKVIKISELIRQLDGLGFDAEGNPK